MFFLSSEPHVHWLIQILLQDTEKFTHSTMFKYPVCARLCVRAWGHSGKLGGATWQITYSTSISDGSKGYEGNTTGGCDTERRNGAAQRGDQRSPCGGDVNDKKEPVTQTSGRQSIPGRGSQVQNPQAGNNVRPGSVAHKGRGTGNDQTDRSR